MDDELKELIERPINYDLSNYSVTDMQLIKSYLLSLLEEINKLTAESTKWEERTYCLQDKIEILENRIDKAREMIRFIAYNSERPLTITELNKVYNILGGDDNE